MILIQKYNKKQLNIIKDLHKSHNWTYLQLLDLDPPKLGFIAYYNQTPIAAGFLRLVEGGYAQIDTLVTDKHSPSYIRHNCLSKLGETLINTAKAKKLKGLVSYSTDKGTITRAVEVGFTVSNHVVLSLPLKG